jgi:hypothetical protein
MCSITANSTAYPQSVKSFDPALIERCAANGITQYTVVQILMALDTWRAAFADLDAASDEVYAYISANSTQYAYETVFHTSLAERLSGLLLKHGETNSRSPLEQKMRNHSRECYPVDKTLREAARMRNGANILRAALAESEDRNG